MSTYTVIGSSNSSVRINAGVYEVRLIQVDIWSGSGSDFWVYAWTGTGSGGSALSLAPTRDTAPPPSATAFSGGSFNAITNVGFVRARRGTQNVPSGSGTTVITEIVGSNFQIIPPLTTTIQPGGNFIVSGIGSSVTAIVTVEELRLSGSY